MKKYIIFILLLVLCLIMINSSQIIECIHESFKICIYNLFPALFPFLIITNLLSKYGFIEECMKIGKRIMPKLFKINASGFYVLIMSVLSGSPSSAKYISQLLNKNYINENDAINLLRCAHFINPLFIIGTIGIGIFHNLKLGIIILISHYLGNLIIGLNNNSLVPIEEKIEINDNNDFVKNLTSSIYDTIDTLLLIMGVITSVFIITTIFNNTFHLNPIFNGLLEITNGIQQINKSSLSNIFKVVLITFFLSFGGLSIHMQVISIINNKKIKYLPYLLARIKHSIISSSIVVLLYLWLSH